MTDRIVYALNTVSGTVAKVDAELLTHPTFGKHLIEVENPDACIECGDQPDEVTTIEGETVALVADDQLDTDEPKPEKGKK